MENPISGSWAEWSTANVDTGLTEDEKVEVLRRFIIGTARTFINQGEISADWANKKFAKLGITYRIPSRSDYVLRIPVSGVVEMGVSAANRAEAVQNVREAVAVRSYVASQLAITDDPTFTSGPEDSDPDVVDPDAPTTVGATLGMLREILMLGNVSGPRWDCDSGTNAVLAAYGLAPLPPRRQFVVTRPAQVTMRTVVTGYDEASAERVAGWRWDNGRTGYTVAEATATDVATVDVN